MICKVKRTSNMLEEITLTLSIFVQNYLKVHKQTIQASIKTTFIPTESKTKKTLRAYCTGFTDLLGFKNIKGRF